MVYANDDLTIMLTLHILTHPPIMVV